MTADAVEAKGAACIHRWLLASPTGSDTKGRCALCGATRVFGDATRAWHFRAEPKQSHD